MEIEYIMLPKLKREIRRADLTGDQVFLCCTPRPAVPVDQMYKMQASSDDDELDPVRCKLSIRMHKLADLYDREKAEFGDLPPHRPGTDHRIRLHSEDNPSWVHPYKMDPSQLDELRRQLDKLHRSGRIRPSSSPYAAGCLLVKKANGKWHMCVDYGALNTRTVRDGYPLPLIQSILSTLGGSTVFSKIDLVSGCHQILIHDEDVEKTAFNTQFGDFEGVVMPFGLCNVPATFQRVVNDVLRDPLGISYGCTSTAFSSSRRMRVSTNDIPIWYMKYCVNTSYFPASIIPHSSRVQYPSADTSSIETGYTCIPKRSWSFEVGLRPPRFMKFDNLTGCLNFTSSLSKGSKLLQPP